ncbi:hypothetical protein ACFL43_04095 [Thermodesulfobacteriota bacterium]
MEGTIISIIGGILLRLILPEPIVILRSGEPDFLGNIPPAHYVGISSEHQDLARAKEEAIFDSIRQIFLNIGSEIYIEFDKTAKNSNGDLSITILDKVNIESSGVLADIQVMKLFVSKAKGEYRVFALVFFPPSKINNARQMIKKENEKRMAQFNSYLKKGQDAQAFGNLDESLKHFKFALGLTDNLFVSRRSYKNLTETHVEDVLELIELRKKRLEEIRLRKPKLRVSPLEVTDRCFAFQIAEVNGKDVSFERYSIHINADYRNSGLISYYVMKVDRQKKASRVFDLIQPIMVNANSTKAVMIPFNSWVRENMDDLKSVVLGSQISYQVVLHSGDISIYVR